MRLTSDANEVCSIPDPADVLKTEDLQRTFSETNQILSSAIDCSYWVVRVNVPSSKNWYSDIAASDSAYPTLLINFPEQLSFVRGTIMQDPDDTSDGSSGSQSLSAHHSILNGDVTKCSSWFVIIDNSSSCFTAVFSLSISSIVTSLRTSSNCWKARECPDRIERHLPELWATNCSIVMRGCVAFWVELIQWRTVYLHHVNHWIDHHGHGHGSRRYRLQECCVPAWVFTWWWAENRHV